MKDIPKDISLEDLDKLGSVELWEIMKKHSRDTEYAHAEADGVLVAIIEHLGLKYTIDAYDKVPKWYA